MKASEKYLIGCVTVMTAAYLWLIWQYSRQIVADEVDEDVVGDLANAVGIRLSKVEATLESQEHDTPRFHVMGSGFVYDDPEDDFPTLAPEGLNRPTVKGLEDE